MYKRCCPDFFYMTPCFLGFLAEKFLNLLFVIIVNKTCEAEKFLKLLFVMIVNKKCARVLSLIENIIKITFLWAFRICLPD